MISILISILTGVYSPLPRIDSASTTDKLWAVFGALTLLVLLALFCGAMLLIGKHRGAVGVALLCMAMLLVIIGGAGIRTYMNYMLSFHTDWCYVRTSEATEWHELPEVTHEAMTEYVGTIFDEHATDSEGYDKALTLFVYFKDMDGQTTKPVMLTVTQFGGEYVAVKGSETTEILTLACELSEAIVPNAVRE